MGRMIDITGKRFNRLVALEIAGRNTGNNVLWRCQCDCGNQIITTGTLLRCGITKSCGCLRKETVAKFNKLSASKTYGMDQPPEIAFVRPVNKEAFTDWWMFGEKDYQNELWFNKLIR